MEKKTAKGYSSIEEMCKFYGIDRSTYDRPRRSGLTISETCKVYGISKELYKSRIRRGWSVEKALTYR